MDGSMVIVGFSFCGGFGFMGNKNFCRSRTLPMVILTDILRIAADTVSECRRFHVESRIEKSKAELRVYGDHWCSRFQCIVLEKGH